MGVLDDLMTGPPGSKRSRKLGSRAKLVALFGHDGRIGELCVQRSSQPPSPLRVFFDWTNELHAFKTLQGLSGQQWSNGRRYYATVYDDDGPNPGDEMSFDEWITECIAAMRGGD